MELLEKRIREDGIVKPGNVLKVDAFLNHQLDVPLLNEIGKEFALRFAGIKVDKILTAESSGIAIAVIAAQYFHCPVVFARKSASINLEGGALTAQVNSLSGNETFHLMVSEKYLRPGEQILILDDILANGCAAECLTRLVKAGHAKVAGIGIVIEKAFQTGGRYLRSQGYRVESLAVVEELNVETGEILFGENE